MPNCANRFQDSFSLAELEQAINYWRMQRPSLGEEKALSPEVNALATVYALMIFHGAKSASIERLDPVARQVFQAWRDQAA